MNKNEEKEETSFYCDCCNYTTSSKFNYERHLSTVKHKKMTKRKNGEKESKTHMCEDCGKVYKYRQGLSFHRKTCTGKTLIKQYLEEREKENKNEMDELRAQVALLMEQNAKLKANNTRITNTNNNTTNNTTNNTQNIYITVNTFGKENIDYITDKAVCKAISMAPFKTIPNIIRMIHFDPEHPENHNVKMTNRKLKYAEVFKDNEWVTTSREKAMNDMIQNGYNVAAQKYSDNKEKIKDSKQSQFENFQMKYEDQDAETLRTLKSDVDITLINGTNKIHKKTIKENGE
tara:strand:+ start:2920 stop:3786 length:867 start_codon:yes stop_codon:yes gene_type:complete